MKDVLNSSTPQEQEEMKSIICTHPLKLIHLDFLTIGKEGSDKNVNILVITDHFTQYSQAFIMPKTNCPMCSKNIMGKLPCPLWMAREDNY